jgi:hypothetical protein
LKLVKNILVLITVTGFAVTGWLVGHILRYSNPALWHPPIEQIDPQIKNGFEFEGIRREVVFTRNLALRVFPNEGRFYLGQVLLNPCAGNTYYTSLPAKCRSADGKLVRVGGVEASVLVTPGDR